MSLFSTSSEQRVDRRYVIVAGNIGTGKTTTVKLLGQALQGVKVFEEERSIFLARFLSDPRKYAFINQLSYLIQFLEQAKQVADCNGMVVHDRSIYDSHDIFSNIIHNQGFIDTDAFQLLDRVANVAKMLVKPDLLVYLEAPPKVCLARVRSRAISDEAGISELFMDTLDKAYSQWISNFSLCPVLKISTHECTPQEVVFRVLSIFR